MHETISADLRTPAIPSQTGGPYRRVLFQHIMKTGGTSVVAMLESFFPRHAVFEYGRTKENPAEVYFRSRRATFVHDHSYILDLRTSDSFAFTFLREPFSRLLSARRQWTDASDTDIGQMNAPSATAVIALRSLTLEQILDRVFEHPPALLWFWNHQAAVLGLRHLSHTIFNEAHPKKQLIVNRAWLERNKGNILRTARSQIRSLNYIGLFEDFDDSVREVFGRLGLPVPEATLHLNPRSAYTDESQAELRRRAEPFLDLDYELYEEGRELHARAGRVARGAPADFIRRIVGPRDDRNFGAEEAPGGHGWYPATLRSDKRHTRWSGPGRISTYALTLDPGEYRIEVWLYGAASPRVLEELTISIDEETVAFENAVAGDGYRVLVFTVQRERSGRVELCFDAGETVRNYGFELERIHVIGREAPAFAVHPIVWHDRLHGRTKAIGFDLALRKAQAHGDSIFSAEEDPGGSGWREAHLRQDGFYARWTGPEPRSSFVIYMEPGGYRIELLVCGAVSAMALMRAELSLAGKKLETRTEPAENGRYLLAGSATCTAAGLQELVVHVPETSDGYGIEVQSFRFIGSSGETTAGDAADPLAA